MLASRSRSRWRLLLSAFMLFWVLLYTLQSLHWQELGDPAQLQYATFLMDHGMTPYRDLIEINMPGVYLTNWALMHWLGGGAFTWRIFDIALMVLAAASMIFIAWPYDWFAGVLGAALFILFHGRDGAMQMGQRDLIIAVTFLCAYAFLFWSTRRRTYFPMLGFGIALGIGATMKPTPLPFILVLLVLVGLHLKKRSYPWRRAIVTALVGLLIPLLITAIFLLSRHALGAFLSLVSVTYPYYAGLGHIGYGLLAQDISASLWGIALLASLIAFWNPDARAWQINPRGLRVLVASPREEKERNSWEMGMIGLGLLFGITSYFGQGKGIIYHHYPVAAFLFLWGSLQFTLALRRSAFIRTLGIVGIAYSLVLAPCYAREAHRSVWDMTYTNTLAGDLNRLGGSALNGKVQCVAAFQADCVTTLYRMHLQQATGLFYDYLVFGPGNQRAIQVWRAQWWRELEDNPPQVFVIHIGTYPQKEGAEPGYEKLAAWPLFEQYLNNNYILYADREFPPTHGVDMGYRIYVRRNLMGKNDGTTRKPG